jgi:hypothetical protein
MASTAAAVLTSPPPRNSVAIYPLPCHSAVGIRGISTFGDV